MRVFSTTFQYASSNSNSNNNLQQQQQHHPHLGWPGIRWFQLGLKLIEAQNIQQAGNNNNNKQELQQLELGSICPSVNAYKKEN